MPRRAGSARLTGGPPPPRLLDERADHPRALVLLRVPEHPEREATLRQLDRLHHLVAIGPAVASTPSPSSSTPWWWWDLTSVDSSPTTRAASEPLGQAHRVVPERSRVYGGAARVPSGPGRCCSSVPPAATFNICIPRQTPSSGMSRSSARWPRASSKRSRSGQVPATDGCARRPVRPRIDVRASGQDERVHQVEELVGRLGHDVIGRQQDRHTAGALHRRASTSAARDCTPPATRPSWRSRWRCRSR